MDNDFDLSTIGDGRFHIIGPNTPLIEANDGFIFGTLDVTGYIRAILNLRFEPVKLNRNRLFDLPVLLGPGEREFYYIDEPFLNSLNLSDPAHRDRIGLPDQGDRNGHPDHGGRNGHPDHGGNGHPHHGGPNGH